MSSAQNSRQYFEVGAVVITGFCKFIFVDLLPYKFWYILVASLFWAGYVVWRSVKEKTILKHWGFRTDTFIPSFLQLLPLAVLCIAVFIVYGWIQKSLILSWHIIPTLLLYPLWGFVQQFLIVALVAGNLAELDKFRKRRVWIILITAVIFSVVHYPSLMLMAGTFTLALVYTPSYLQHRNIWTLGLYHGWLACFFYFFVLGRDAWQEVVNTL